MKRSLLVVLAGLLIIAAAMVLDFLPLDDEVSERPPVSTAKPQTVTTPAATIYPSFDVVRINRQGGAVIAGRSAPRAEVVVLDGGREIGRVTADRRGEWVFLPDQPLVAGGREIALRAVNPDGTTVDGREPVVLAVPKEGDQASPALAVRLTSDRADIVLQGPTKTAPAGGQPLEVTAVTNLGNEGFYVLGSAPPAASVRLFLNGRDVGAAKADGDGRWRLAAKVPVIAGKHLLRAEQVGGTGDAADRVEVTVDAAFGPPVAGVIVDPGEESWRIVRRRAAKDKAPDFAILYEGGSGRQAAGSADGPATGR